MNEQLLLNCYNLLLDYKSLLEERGEIQEAEIVLDTLDTLEIELDN